MTQKITTVQAEIIAKQLYNINGKANALVGEIDLNFKISGNNLKSYILKLSPVSNNKNNLELQNTILKHLNQTAAHLNTPKVYSSTTGNDLEILNLNETPYFVRLLSWTSGRLWHNVNPKLDDLRLNLGQYCGQLTQHLQGFKAEHSTYNFDWDLAQSLWTESQLPLFNEKEQSILTHFISKFKTMQPNYKALRKSIIHNDVNDNNIIVTENLKSPSVIGVIDFGDAIYSQCINDLAVLLAYGIMDVPNPMHAALPIIEGYNKHFKLLEEELKTLYTLVGMRLVISVTKSAQNKVKHPENTYLSLSEKPAWNLLEKWANLSEEEAYYNFRLACNFTAHPNEVSFNTWAKTTTFEISDLFPDIKSKAITPIDLSIGSPWLGHKTEFNNFDFFQYQLKFIQKSHPNTILSGGYLEARALYTSKNYEITANSGRENRSIHLGIDFWLEERTKITAPLEGKVLIASIDQDNKGYGGLIILEHHIKSWTFYSIYGHLSHDSIIAVNIGQTVDKNQCIGYLGNTEENGEWVPHLHFQLSLSLLNNTTNFPGVALPSEKAFWSSICPDPNILFKLNELTQTNTNNSKSLLKRRKQHLGPNLSLNYKSPLLILRGDNQYLINENGQRYLDTVNNVAHVGHENYNVVAVAKNQIGTLNTNTRYLHPNIVKAAERLKSKLPQPLDTIYFVNSGSEANELAIRMARTATTHKTILVSEMGYHGNTSTCIDISSYKFEGKGGYAKPESTEILPLPDTFKGRYNDPMFEAKYKSDIDEAVQNITSQGNKLAAVILEPIISCGGQIELPQGYLKYCYNKVRAAGGVCISDEVQTGLGRMGKTFWGFELHGVTPDIVTIGKPLGNGHPVAAVACTREIAEAFSNGMEYFNTFGGNPVSCAIANEVLSEIESKNLQGNALKVGEYLKASFSTISKSHPILADVRGQGLFLGLEFCNTDLLPLPQHTKYIVERMLDYGILMSVDGKDLNVLKIKPPLTFSMEDAKELLYYFERILNEDYMKNY
ncbi:MAG: peptidase M23 [Bacteroidetes bacterium MedPE-SWsnd-G2]|nr:MAG: peptidase M23 [Bacteroidetes bacterium MedPE-SWsnd-G2]